MNTSPAKLSPLAVLFLFSAAQAQAHGGMALPNVLRQGRVALSAGQEIPPTREVPVDSEGRPVGPDQDLPGEGPAAALALEQSLRGDETNAARRRAMYFHPDKSKNFFPAANPIMMQGLRNVVPMTPALWQPADIIADFEARKTGEQTAIVVFLKTEFCHRNAARLCAVTTAALEKRSTPLLRQFRVYGAWIKDLALEHVAPADVPRIVDWHQQMIDTWGFEQGPGARVVVLVKMNDGTWAAAASNAAQLGLYIEEFERNGGRTPGLEAMLRRALEAADRGGAPQ